jgi:predicted aspartyl protease
MLGTSSVLLGCAFQSPVAIIPVEIVNGNAVTSARIGDEQIDVIVDTGGLGGIAISPEDLKRLKVIFTGDSIERTDSAGDTFESRAFVVPELFLGGHRFAAIPGFERVGSASGFAGGPPMNVLGRALLHDFTVVVDYPNGEIRLYSPDQAKNVCGTLTSELIEMEDDILALHIQTDGGQMLALMDTGATYSFVQSKVVASRKLKTVDDFYRTRTFRVGVRDFGPLEMVVLPINGAPEIDALVGANFFSNHEVCFDYSGRMVSFLD